MDFQQVISDHWPLIERQCLRAVKRLMKNYGYRDFGNPLNIENEALELSNHVLDILKHDDYKALRQFKGNSKIGTYMTAIIARQSVDIIRKKLGRNREKERAKHLGKIGIAIYEQVIRRSSPISETFRELKKSGEFQGSLEDFETLVEKIKGRKTPLTAAPGDGENSAVKNGFLRHPDLDDEEWIIPDNNRNPETLMMKEQHDHQVKQLLKNIVEQLNGEERLILRLRFPTGEEEKSAKVGQIAGMLHMSEKAVYKRIGRILSKCKTIISKNGVSVDELFFFYLLLFIFWF